MIYTIGNVPRSEKYKSIRFEDFIKWIATADEYELDIETTMTNSWCDKKLVSMQFGYKEFEIFIRWADLSIGQKSQLKELLENPRQLKIIHNATFEDVVLRFHGINIENLYCTMVAEKIILGGYEQEGKESLYSLQSVVRKRIGVELDKSEQTTFNEDEVTENQVIYGITDVKYMREIRRQQLEEIAKAKLDKVLELEMEVLMSYNDITYNGMELNTSEWLKNLDLVEPLIDEGIQKLTEAVYSDPVLLAKMQQLGYLSMENQLVVNWNSSQQKSFCYRLLFPDLEQTTKASLQKFLKRFSFGDEWDNLLLQALDKNYKPIEEVLEKYFVGTLIENNLYIPAGVITINWNSRDQVLSLLQAVDPKLKDMSADSMAKFSHPIGNLITDYKDTLKLRSTYGETFIEKYLEPDGKIRTNFNQIVSTGRVSTSKPNMQNIPAKETVGNRYRNAFVCPTGWKYVDSDYSSQELVLIAYLSKDPVWIKALEDGKDLHSVCAELVFKDKWKAAAESDCNYYQLGEDRQPLQQKCKCKGHKSLRDGVKRINFGLAYGMTKFKLAGDMGITPMEAEALILEYFKTFPKIGSLLNYLGRFGVENGYIQTVYPFYRKRYFPDWNRCTPSDITAHLTGVKPHKVLGSIERASKNMPIQGSSADIAKLSLVYIRRFIRANNLTDSILLVAQVHDQDTTICKEEIAEWWAVELTRLMEEAAAVIVDNGLLKAETNVTDRWSK